MPIDKNIQKKLNKFLGPEFLAVRQGAGGSKLTYVEGHMVIEMANRIFGYNGWKTKIKKLKQEYCDDKDGKVSVAYTCICRIMLSDGTTKEDVGLGHAENQRSKALAIEKATKEAVTDSFKRAFRQFGNVLGNCCYDKGYIGTVSKMKKPVEKPDYSNMLRKTDLFNEEHVINESEIPEDFFATNK
ncbi:RAD52 [Enterospora canceri]|uniref:RAD52 n=1 Tax=Enterospora canceri TaxID=1081671 RepID=A0A1Y1SA08_9MICR|nr:RAD52 [Enterospora canceri]